MTKLGGEEAIAARLAPVIATPAHERCRGSGDGAGVSPVLSVAEQRSGESDNLGVGHVEVRRRVTAEHHRSAPGRGGVGVGENPPGTVGRAEAELEAVVDRSVARDGCASERDACRPPHLGDRVDEIGDRRLAPVVDEVRATQGRQLPRYRAWRSTKRCRRLSHPLTAGQPAIQWPSAMRRKSERSERRTVDRDPRLLGGLGAPDRC